MTQWRYFAWICFVGFSTLVIVLAPARVPLTGQAADAELAAIACGQYASFQVKAVRGVEGQVVCFHGKIDRSSANDFMSIPIEHGSMVVVDSPGGDVVSSLDMADYILAKNVTMVVKDRCLSSCANYLFLAGDTKIVLPNSFVGFHGGPSVNSIILDGIHARDDAQIFADARSRVQSIITRQHEFYHSIHVDEDIIYHGPKVTRRRRYDREHEFWEFGPETLKNVYGVEGIAYFFKPSSISFGEKWLSNFVGVSCEDAGTDAWICSV